MPSGRKPGNFATNWEAKAVSSEVTQWMFFFLMFVPKRGLEMKMKQQQSKKNNYSLAGA